MTGEVVLTPRATPEHRAELECIAPDRFASLSEREIAALAVWIRGQEARLGDLFDVRGERAPAVRIAGDVRWGDGIGWGMAGGTLRIEGSAGRGVGTAMSAGVIDVEGDTDDDAGVAMAGGTLRIAGRSGDRVGSARGGGARGATGGEIIVRGAAGADVGAVARRVLIAVGGNVGEGAGRAMIAGSVIVLGDAGADAGRWSKRGTLAVMGTVAIGATYRRACTFRPPHLRLTLVHLRDRHGLPVHERHISGRYDRYSGDMAALGKGEILHWVPE